MTGWLRMGTSSFNMMVQRGHWGAPSVMAALAGFVHDGESTASYERNDNDAYNAAGPNWWRINRKIGRNRRQLLEALCAIS